MPEPRVYPPADRPDILVEVDGEWHQGELRAWFPSDDGWVGNVQWRREAGRTYLDTFPAERIRLDNDESPATHEGEPL